MAKKKILVVEDDRSMREALTDMLKLSGVDALNATDGQEGMETALKEHPDLVILDIVMPRMDGIDAFKKIREDDWGKNAKVIFLTNLAGDERMEEVTKKEEMHFIVKSNISLKEVIAKINKTLNE